MSDVDGGMMEWLRERCMRLNPGCICTRCENFTRRIDGTRCCVWAAVGKRYIYKETCGISKCPGFRAVKMPPRGANTEAAAKNLDTPIIGEKEGNVNV